MMSSLYNRPFTRGQNNRSQSDLLSWNAPTIPKTIILPFYKCPSYESAEIRWKTITESLLILTRNPLLNTVNVLSKAILSYNPIWQKKWSFEALIKVVNVHLTKQKREQFLQETLPKMAMLALRLPELVPEPLALLSAGESKCHILSKMQIASLLANAFFCTYPRRNNPTGGEFANYPSINFNGLYCYHGGRAEEASHAKLLCLLNYFHRVTSTDPQGCVTFYRQHVPEYNLPHWATSSKIVCGKKLKIHLVGNIEGNGNGMLQVTFANRKYGGGVLDSGSVQEEVRCIVCPEMIIARLFTEALEKNEAFFVFGVEQYCTYSGYAETLKFVNDYVDMTERADNGQVKCTVVALDALDFSQPLHTFKISGTRRMWVSGKLESFNYYTSNNKMHVQYHPDMVQRELNKAFVGFKDISDSQNPSPVATGNWGCGAYQGDPLLKYLIQAIAASEAGRILNYYAFGNKQLTSKLRIVVSKLTEKQYTVGKLFTILQEYHKTGGELHLYLLKCLQEPVLTTSAPNISASNYNKEYPPLPQRQSQIFTSSHHDQSSLPASSVQDNKRSTRYTKSRSAQDSSGLTAALYEIPTAESRHATRLPSPVPPDKNKTTTNRSSVLGFDACTPAQSTRHSIRMPSPETSARCKNNNYSPSVLQPGVNTLSSGSHHSPSSVDTPHKQGKDYGTGQESASQDVKLNKDEAWKTTSSNEEQEAQPKNVLMQLDLVSDSGQMKLKVLVNETELNLHPDSVLKVASDKNASFFITRGIKWLDIKDQLYVTIPVNIEPISEENLINFS